MQQPLACRHLHRTSISFTHRIIEYLNSIAPRYALAVSSRKTAVKLVTGPLSSTAPARISPFFPFYSVIKSLHFAPPIVGKLFWDYYLPAKALNFRCITILLKLYYYKGSTNFGHQHVLNIFTLPNLVIKCQKEFISDVECPSYI